MPTTRLELCACGGYQQRKTDPTPSGGQKVRTECVYCGRGTVETRNRNGLLVRCTFFRTKVAA